MGDISYKPLIDSMKWSYSRIKAHDQCPYRWYLKYIRHKKEKSMFYSTYGSFIHKLIEQFYRGEISQPEMVVRFLRDYKNEVRGIRPKKSTLDKYINGAISYLESFRPFPYEMVAVEKEVNFNLGGYDFVGFIDYLGRDSDGKFVVVDNKSRDIRPRSKRTKPTLKDKELDDMLVQLYLYSYAVEQEYGERPKLLCFNCFRTGAFIIEEFDDEAYEKAKQWAVESINEIAEDSDFEPRVNLFSCFWICGVNHYCDEYQDKK